jgi:large subunit ribosomal protein L24
MPKKINTLPPKPGQQEGKPKVKKGDEVLVITGKDRGRRGKVISVDSKKYSCIIESINEYKKHEKPKGRGMQGGIITVAMPVHLSNVMVIDKSTNKPSRVGRKLVGDQMLRYAKRSGQLLDHQA